MDKKPDKKIETIFDHNMTDEERGYMCVYDTLEELLESGMSQDDCYLDIAILYKWRGDEETSQKYLNKMSEENRVGELIIDNFELVTPRDPC